MEVRTFGLVASGGTGNSISTFVAVLHVNRKQKVEKRVCIKWTMRSYRFEWNSLQENKFKEYLLSLNWLLAFTISSIRLLECLSIWASTQTKGFTYWINIRNKAKDSWEITSKLGKIIVLVYKANVVSLSNVHW